MNALATKSRWRFVRAGTGGTMSQLPLHTAIRAARRLVLALACTGVALGLSLLSRGRTEPM